MAGDSYQAWINPGEPALRHAGLKYVVFPRQLARAEAAGMHLVDALPEHLVWIYRLDSALPATDAAALAAN